VIQSTNGTFCGVAYAGAEDFYITASSSPVVEQEAICTDDSEEDRNKRITMKPPHRWKKISVHTRREQMYKQSNALSWKQRKAKKRKQYIQQLIRRGRTQLSSLKFFC